MRGLEKNCIGRGQTGRHRDSMKASAQKAYALIILQTLDFKLYSIKLCFPVPLCLPAFDIFILKQVIQKYSLLDCFS